jgi:predicted RNase H-like nuclease (RuvC/YqgF family)
MLKVESESSTLIAKLQEQIVFLKNHVQGQDARIELLEQKLKEVNKNFNSIC